MRVSNWGDEYQAQYRCVREIPLEVAPKVRLKDLAPSKVVTGVSLPVRVQISTSLLAPGHQYRVACTHQWSHTTYDAEACLLPDHRGVELILPKRMLQPGPEREGLYDVHLVIDNAYRAENRKAITVMSADEAGQESPVGTQVSTWDRVYH